MTAAHSSVVSKQAAESVTDILSHDCRAPIAGANELLADRGLGIAAEKNAMGQDAGAFARTFHRPDDVQEVATRRLSEPNRNPFPTRGPSTDKFRVARNTCTIRFLIG